LSSMAAANQVITRNVAAVRPEDDKHDDVLKHVDVAIYTANKAGRQNYRRQVRAPDGPASLIDGEAHYESVTRTGN
jgi:predicted metal-dependent HD superfamily phosphohydrolase